MRSVTRIARVLALGLCAFGVSTIGYQLNASHADDGVRLTGNHPAQAEAFTPLGDAALDAPLELQIRFALRNRAALDRLLADQQNPASGRYHKWLKTGEFYSRFGPSGSELEALESWLKSEGFAVTSRAAGYLDFTGNVAQAQQAFEVRIARFGDGSRYANTSDPAVPQRFASAVGAILGLDNMVVAVPVTHQPFSEKGDENRLYAPGKQITQLAQAERESSETSGEVPVGNVIINGTQAFGPNDLRTFYDETVGPGQDGSGDCIAIVGVSDFLDSTMTAFTNQFGLPAINYIRKLHGANPGINSNGETEAELDLQWAHAAAPGASIVYHLGSNLVTDITGAVTDNSCGAVSISYAFCSPSASLIENTLDPLFQQAAAQGQSVFVSSGDQGAAGLALSGNKCVANSSKSVNEMSADPNVTSVGGTQFTPTYSGGSDVGHATEKVWNDGGGATGGGASQFFPKPGYQTGAGVPNDAARDVPDISLIASPNFPGVFWGHDNSGTVAVTCCIGGTSLSAPLWAGFSRVMAQLSGTARLGNLNPLIYSLANTRYSSAGFHDVTIGNNNFNGVTGFTAGPGYDQASGWGTIDFNLFANAVAARGTPTATPTAPGVTTTPTPTPGLGPTPTPTPTPQPTGGTLSVPTAIRFPTVGLGLRALSRTVFVSNTSLSSSLTLDIGKLRPPLTLIGAGHYSLAPDTRVPVTIIFTPDRVGAVNQQLPISSSDPKHPNMMVAVSGMVQAGRLSAPAKVALVAKPGTAVTKTVILRNSGKGMLAGTIQPFGQSTNLTLVGGSASFSLAPGQTEPITIQFAPASAGVISANLAIDTNPPAGTTMIVVTGSAR